MHTKISTPNAASESKTRIEENVQQVAKPKALFILDEPHWDEVYGPLQRADLERITEVPRFLHTKDSILQDSASLAEAEIIFGSWTMPILNEAFLEMASKLKAIFYAAGSIRYFVTDAIWDRGIRITSCAKAMGVTVSEFALAQILLSLKSMWQHNAKLRRDHKWEHLAFAGIYESTVGLVSLGTVAQNLVKLLKNFKVKVIAFDPTISQKKARELGVELCTLEEVFSQSDVVSLHTPWLPETERLIRGHHLDRMRLNSTLINTSRGAIIAEDEMIEVLRRRPDLYALLDVTHPEPPEAGSPLFLLPNVLLTPHMSGTCGNERRRLAEMVISDCKRYLSDQPLDGEITRDMMAYIA